MTMIQLRVAEPSYRSLRLNILCNQIEIGNGTGVIVESNRGPCLVTNRHNVTGRDQNTQKPLHSSGGLPTSIQIMHNKRKRLMKWRARTEALYNLDGTPRWVEHPTLKDKMDCVILPLSQVDGISWFPYDLVNCGPNIAIGVAEVVSVVGFPFGLSSSGSLAIWATGFVATDPDIDYDGLPLILIDCRSRPGQSGSAVIAYRNGGSVAMGDGAVGHFNQPVFRLIGIYSGRINSQSDLGFVWKTDAIMEILEEYNGRKL